MAKEEEAKTLDLPKELSVRCPVLIFLNVLAVGEVSHTCQNDLVCIATQKDVPKTRRVFNENKQEIGMIDEVLGPVSNFVSSLGSFFKNSYSPLS